MKGNFFSYGASGLTAHLVPVYILMCSSLPLPSFSFFFARSEGDTQMERCCIGGTKKKKMYNVKNTSAEKL